MPSRKAVQGIGSVEIAGRLLAALADAMRPMNLSKVAAAAKMPASKARRYLVSLCRAQLVHQNSDTGQYGVGSLVLRLAFATPARQELMPVALPVMKRLRDELNETVSLVIWTERGPLVLHYEESDHPVRLNTVTGSIMPIITSASGQVFGAFSKEEEVAEAAKNELKQLIKSGKSRYLSWDDVERMFNEIADRGIARAVGTVLPGISGLGCPIRRKCGSLAGALVVTGHKGSMDSRLNGTVASALMAAAKEISRSL